jgi:hypothetical protein
MAAWAFVVLLLSGVLALVASAYIFFWQDHVHVDDNLEAAKDVSPAESVAVGWVNRSAHGSSKWAGLMNLGWQKISRVGWWQPLAM